MENSLLHYYISEKNRVLEKCTQCAQCIKKCPIIKNTELKNLAPKTIQKEILKFLEDGMQNEIAYTRAFSCMECFGCVDNHCPQGLNPMLINEMIRHDYRYYKYKEDTYNDPRKEDALQRIIASIQISKTDYEKILTPSPQKAVDYVFFPGCNVYFQPDKLLNALDIMEILNVDWAFLPGLDFCCGNGQISAGVLEEANFVSEKLIDTLSSYNPKKVIFWCPTCLCRFETTYSKLKRIPFEVVSFPQFVAENIDKLPFKKAINKTVTLHEACKSGFTGLDLNGARDLLKSVPGISLVEMPRHGKNTSCCGSGAISYFYDGFEIVRDERMKEAAKTKADILVDVCHYCHEVFMAKEENYDYTVVNYVSLVAEALGITREDKLKKYKQFNNLDKILDGAEDYIKQSPFSRSQIIEALKYYLI